MGGLVQGRQKRVRKLRLEVDWTLLLFPPSPKARKKRRKPSAANKRKKIAKKGLGCKPDEDQQNIKCGAKTTEGNDESNV